MRRCCPSDKCICHSIYVSRSCTAILGNNPCRSCPQRLRHSRWRLWSCTHRNGRNRRRIRDWWDKDTCCNICMNSYCKIWCHSTLGTWCLSHAALHRSTSVCRGLQVRLRLATVSEVVYNVSTAVHVITSLVWLGTAAGVVHAVASAPRHPVAAQVFGTIVLASACCNKQRAN